MDNSTREKTLDQMAHEYAQGIEVIVSDEEIRSAIRGFIAGATKGQQNSDQISEGLQRHMLAIKSKESELASKEEELKRLRSALSRVSECNDLSTAREYAKAALRQPTE